MVPAAVVFSVAAVVFLSLAAVRLVHDGGRLAPASRTWLLVGAVFAVVAIASVCVSSRPASRHARLGLGPRGPAKCRGGDPRRSRSSCVAEFLLRSNISI